MMRSVKSCAEGTNHAPSGAIHSDISTEIKQLAFCLLCTLIVLLPASKSSPLYPMNDWVDVQCFFTVGREMLKGKMPYLDLYEQKGPLLYLLFAFASLISSSDFTGVFILEVLCFTLFLDGALHLITRDGRRAMALIAVPVTACLTVLAPSFRHGTSAEELTLFLYTGSLALIWAPSREKRPFGRRECVFLGAAFAAVLLIKYTGGLFFLPLFLYGLIYQIRAAGPKAGAAAAGLVLLGMLGTAAAVLLPYALGGALPDLWDVYVVKNLSGYSFHTPRYGTPLQQLLLNGIITLPAAAGIVLLMTRRGSRALSVTSLAAGALLFYGTYYSGRTYPYYAMVFAALTPLGFAGLAQLLPATGESAKKALAVLTAAAVVLSGALSWTLTENAYLRFRPREEMPPYRFAEIIAEGGGGTLLNDGFLDGGFYLAAGISPNCPYFCELALKQEAWTALRDQMITEGAFDWIVTRGRAELPRSYELTAQCTYPFEGRDWTYYLFRLQ